MKEPEGNGRKRGNNNSDNVFFIIINILKYFVLYIFFAFRNMMCVYDVRRVGGTIFRAGIAWTGVLEY